MREQLSTNTQKLFFGCCGKEGYFKNDRAKRIFS